MYGVNVGNFYMVCLIVYFLCLTASNLNMFNVIKAVKASKEIKANAKESSYSLSEYKTPTAASAGVVSTEYLDDQNHRFCSDL